MSDLAILAAAYEGVGTITLNRPDRHNTFDDALIAELIDALTGFAEDEDVRFVVLRANGPTFSAGGDIAWLRRVADQDEAANLADAARLAELMRTLNELPKPTIALVQGPAYGGGVGLVACCDIAVAADSAMFCLSEVRLGLVPAVIGPYVVRAIGPRAARRCFLTAEPFGAGEALRLGLVHEIVPATMLEAAEDRLIGHLRLGGPRAQAAAKRLIADVAYKPPAVMLEEGARLIAELRASDEGKEGLSAFLDKRSPRWIEDWTA